jgi:hypothetical protein
MCMCSGMLYVELVVIVEEDLYELSNTSNNQFNLLVGDVECGCYDDMVTVGAISAARTGVDKDSVKLGETYRRVSQKYIDISSHSYLDQIASLQLPRSHRTVH